MVHIVAELSYYIDYRKAEPTYHVLVYLGNSRQEVVIHDLAMDDFYLAIGRFKLVVVEFVNDSKQEVFGFPWQQRIP